MKLSRVIDYFKQPSGQNAPRAVHCLFYSHPWTVYCLENLGLVDPKTDILVELASESHFAKALDPFNTRQYSLLTLLQPHKQLHQLAKRFKGVAAPMLLAPSQPASLASVLAAAALLNTSAGPINKAVVLVHVRDAPALASAYSYMDVFSVVWDVADYPDASFPDLAESLAAAHCLDKERWRGVHFCNQQQRRLPDAGMREAALKQLLAEFPALTGV